MVERNPDGSVAVPKTYSGPVLTDEALFRRHWQAAGLRDDLIDNLWAEHQAAHPDEPTSTSRWQQPTPIS